jgi:hypothetical protein
MDYGMDSQRGIFSEICDDFVVSTLIFFSLFQWLDNTDFYPLEVKG